MKRIAAIILILLLPISAFGMDGFSYVTYNISLPSGAMTDIVSDPSFKGLEIGIRQFVKRRNLTVGLMTGWNLFEDKRKGLVEFSNGAAYGTNQSFVNTFPIMVNSHYYFGSKRGPRPYVGLNAGTTYIGRREYLGVYTVEDSNWHLSLAPEIGLIYPMGGSSLFLNVKYDYAFRSGGSIDYGYWGFNVGFAFSAF